MNRHKAILSLPQEQPDLEGMIERLLAAVRECKAENKDPSSDAAVILLGGQVAFLTHADVATSPMYSKLYERCVAAADSEVLFGIEGAN